MEKQRLLPRDPEEGYELYGSTESSTERPSSSSSDVSQRDLNGTVISRLFRRLFIGFCLSIGLYYLGTRAPFGHVNVPSPVHYRYGGGGGGGGAGDVEFSSVDGSKADNKVPLEAHIMSKCPDARDCLQRLVVPAMESVNDIVDFKLSFIAR